MLFFGVNDFYMCNFRGHAKWKRLSFSLDFHLSLSVTWGNFKTFCFSVPGMLQPAGHVDFYPTPGWRRTGCNLLEGNMWIINVLKGIINEYPVASHWNFNQFSMQLSLFLSVLIK